LAIRIGHEVIVSQAELWQVGRSKALTRRVHARAANPGGPGGGGGGGGAGGGPLALAIPAHFPWAMRVFEWKAYPPPPPG
jgi:hypothetical protein